MVITSVAMVLDAYTSTTTSMALTILQHPTPAQQHVKNMDFHLQVFTMALNALAPVSRHVSNHWITRTVACHADQPRLKCVGVILLPVCIPVRYHVLESFTFVLYLF